MNHKVSLYNRGLMWPWMILGLGVYHLWGFFFHLRRRLRVQSVPRSKIAAAAIGPVEIQAFGVKAADEDLRSPLTGQPCLYYKYRILKRTKNGKSSSYSEVYSEDSSHVPFLVQDETGQAWIYPMGSEFSSIHREVLHGGQYTIRTREALSRLGRSEWALDSDNYRLEEEILVPGDSVYSLGYLHPTQDFLRNEISGQIIDKVRRVKERPDILKKIDRDGDGRISAAEWDAAREKLERSVKEHYSAVRGSKVLGFKSKNLFILSNYHERSLLGQFGFFAIAKLVGGLAMILGASAYLLVQLKF